MKRVYILRLIIRIVLSVVCLPDTWALARSTDFVARYGGEEFVFLAPGTELAGALQRAEKLIAAMATLNLAHSGSPYARVTLSIGVAAM